MFDDEIMLFTNESLQGINLSSGGLLLYALLCGGDYDSGVEDCGHLTAYGLVKCGFGDRLINALNTLHGIDLDTFLSTWRADLCLELTTNSQKMLTQCQPVVASHIHDTFPTEHVLHLYANPLTSWSMEPPSIPNSGAWIAREPSLRELTAFCMDNFHWDTGTLLKKFSTHVWTGTFLQMIYSVSLLTLSYFLLDLPGQSRSRYTTILSA